MSILTEKQKGYVTAVGTEILRQLKLDRRYGLWQIESAVYEPVYVDKVFCGALSLKMDTPKCKWPNYLRITYEQVPDAYTVEVISDIDKTVLRKKDSVFCFNLGNVIDDLI